MTSPNSHAAEVAAGARFQFGKNWSRFLSVLDEDRIREAEHSLQEMLGITHFRGQRFLDVGSGSGLFSLAARRMGAQVHSFDYDPQSVACARELKRRYFPDDPDWCIQEGSILDAAFVGSLGTFDVVYAWGMLHHTGDMWQASEHVVTRVAPSGLLYIALYNDQGFASRIWRGIKRVYCSGLVGRWIMTGLMIPGFAVAFFTADVIRLRNPIRRYTHYRHQRGMSLLHDWIDWLGGYPFEVAKPEEAFEFFRQRGFGLNKLKTTNGLGNNEFVFAQTAPDRNDSGTITTG